MNSDVLVGDKSELPILLPNLRQFFDNLLISVVKARKLPRDSNPAFHPKEAFTGN